MRLSKRFFKSSTVQALIAALAAGYVTLVTRTVRWTVQESEVSKALRLGNQPFIACFWHGRMLYLRRAWNRERPCHVLISAHSDGVLISRAIARLGVSTIKGSSKKGGMSALRAMQRILEQGDIVGITPDGPRGPRMRAKSGSIKLAQLSGMPILPITGNTSRRRIFKSWDRFCLPLPFARGVIMVGDPITLTSNADDTELESCRQNLEESLNRLTAEADRHFGQITIEPADARP
ncbi:lysophospholipid acyltransferase family protein [Pelagibius sp. Alg239-R121]|uniref:lysophospholipid acyltransferase family protein n=1 Tax=Pelagibius sp. Alg239-R121 TaxID=2993448 RepID=UPI0024A6B60A|nr:lysophospholipid acyltransferase family protein [Pelagibius sp. Alg239-R121]